MLSTSHEVSAEKKKKIQLKINYEMTKTVIPENQFLELGLATSVCVPYTYTTQTQYAP